MCLLPFGQSVTAASILPAYQTTNAGTSPSHAWTIPGQPQVINHQGGYGSDGWDNVTQWDGAPDNTENSYLKFGGNNANQPDYQIRQYARQTTTPGLFDVFLNVKGNKQMQSKPVDVVLVTDMSGSMNASSNGGFDRVSAVRNGIKNFMKSINEAGIGDYVNVGFVGFAGQDGPNISGIRTENIDRISNSNHVDRINQILAQDFQSGTFTQKGLREGQRMLANDQSSNKKMMILLTDGWPTQSYKVTQAQKKDGQVMGTAFSQEWDYPGISSQFWQFNGNPPSWQQRSPKSYSVDGQEIRDTWAGTLGEAYLIRGAGTKLHALGIQLDKDSGYTDNNSDTYLTKTQVHNRMALMASPGQYQDANSVEDVENYLVEQVKDVTSEFYTVKNGTVHNPIGEQFTYADAQPEVTSVGKEPVGTLPIVTRDAQQLDVNGISLGRDQEIQVHYQVHLKTEDRNFQPNFWYQVSGETTFKPTEKSGSVTFGVPSAKASGTKFQVTKQWIDDIDRTKRPDQIQLEIGRKVGDQLTDWRAIGQLTAADNWQKTFTKGLQDGQSVWLPAYNNQGQTFDYQVVNEQTASYVTKVEHQDNQATVINCQYGLLINKVVEGTTSPVKGAKFTVSSKDGHQVFTVESGQCQLLTPGDYTIQESQAPLGFKADSATFHLTLTSDGQWLSDGQAISATTPEPDGDGLKDGFSIAKTLSHNASQTNVVQLTKNNQVKPFTLLVKKTDAQTSLPLAGAQFGLKSLSGDTLIPNTNRDATEFTFTHLMPGSYTLTELQAPKGYFRAEPVVITVSPDGRSQVTGGSKQWSTTLTTDHDDNQITLQVPNRNQAVFPKTGGAGQLPYFIVAGCMVSVGFLLSAAYQQVQRRRQGK